MLYILTTATPRPELHNETVINAVKELCNRVDQINWYINIDCPKQFFSENHRKVTADNFLTLQSPNLKTIILAKHSTAHFGRAARRLYHTCKPEGNDDIFMWLEDDWVFRSNECFFELFNNFLSSNQNFLLCSKNKYVSGNPFFFRRDFFDHIVNKLNSNVENFDPELLFFWCVEQKYNIKYKELPPNSIHKEVFFDAGRKWRESHNIIKYNKKITQCKKETWGTSQKQKTD